MHRPCDRLDEGGRGQASEHHVVQEHHVEVPQPVVAAEVPEEIEPGDPWIPCRWKLIQLTSWKMVGSMRKTLGVNASVL